MSLSHHHQRHLHRIETGLLRSDPQLAAMLGVFGRLSAGEAMPAERTGCGRGADGRGDPAGQAYG